MPIHAPIALPRLSVAEMREIDYPVMAQAFATHRELGRLCDEGIFHALACTNIDRSLGV